MSKEKFFNFPIQLLQQAPNMFGVCDDIIDYAFYVYALTLSGTFEEQVKSAERYFGITFNDPKRSIENGDRLSKRIPARSPMTGINRDLLFSFYKGDQSLSEIAVLVAHLAIKSILGKKSYCRITSDYLLCRMAGYPSIKAMNGRRQSINNGLPERRQSINNGLPERRQRINNGLPEYLKPYTTRRRMDGIKAELRKSYGLKIYGRYTRGFFVTEKLSLEELIKEVEMKRKKYWQANQKNELSTAVTKVLKELYQ